MQQLDLEGIGIRLVQKENVLAVFSAHPLKIVGSAFHNGGGISETRAILNIEVPKDYGDTKLHLDPDGLVVETGKKLDLKERFVAMITAACVENFAFASKREDDIGVSVIATAADNEGHTCDHAESSGEKIEAMVVENGTINIIVVIDANPNDACLVSSIITATEAKTAAMLELDIRSRYSGIAATGTITDAVVCAKTGLGEPIVFGGPASKLGQLVGFCTKKAVKEAIMKGRECSPTRSLNQRLAERHISIEKMAKELSKVPFLNVTYEGLIKTLNAGINQYPLFASILLAAVRLDEDTEKGLLSPEMPKVNEVAQLFGSRVGGCNKISNIDEAELSKVGLSPFLKQTLIGLIRNPPT